MAEIEHIEQLARQNAELTRQVSEMAQLMKNAADQRLELSIRVNRIEKILTNYLGQRLGQIREVIE